MSSHFEKFNTETEVVFNPLPISEVQIYKKNTGHKESEVN